MENTQHEISVNGYLGFGVEENKGSNMLTECCGEYLMTHEEMATAITEVRGFTKGIAKDVAEIKRDLKGNGNPGLIARVVSLEHKVWFVKGGAYVVLALGGTFLLALGWFLKEITQ